MSQYGKSTAVSFIIVYRCLPASLEQREYKGGGERHTNRRPGFANSPFLKPLIGRCVMEFRDTGTPLGIFRGNATKLCKSQHTCTSISGQTPPVHSLTSAVVQVQGCQFCRIPSSSESTVANKTLSMQYPNNLPRRATAAAPKAAAATKGGGGTHAAAGSVRAAGFRGHLALPQRLHVDHVPLRSRMPDLRPTCLCSRLAT